MKELKFRPITAQEVEIKPTDTKVQGKCTLLLFIDSRAAAQILNETVGVMNWQIEYKDVAGKIYGRLSIWDEDRGCWIYKEDTGSEGNIEADKSLSSDILKRCLARWGCDYLYYTPRVQITCPDKYYYNGKMTMRFSVRELEFNGKECTKLVIVDRFGNVVYSYGEQKPQQRQDGVYIPQPVWDAIMAAKSVAELANIWNSNSQLQVSEKFKRQLGKKKAELRRPA